MGGAPDIRVAAHGIFLRNEESIGKCFLLEVIIASNAVTPCSLHSCLACVKAATSAVCQVENLLRVALGLIRCQARPVDIGNDFMQGHRELAIQP